jgi:hypothetical protein
MGRGRHGFLIVAAVGGVVAAGACGDEASRPHQLTDFIPDAAAAVDGPGTFVDPPSAPPTCNLGPEGGVCACVDQPLVLDPPTMYFVLDTSGSMSEDNKWRSVQLVVGNLVTQLGPRARFGAATFPNQHVASTACAPGVEVFPPTAGDPVAGTAGSTEQNLLTILGEIPASGGTPTAATLQGLTNRLTSLSGRTYVILATDGGPNCDADITCDASQCQPNIESSPAGCTPTGPSCCTSETGTSLSCLDAQPTIDAVTALATAGIPVYIVGAPGSEPYADLLDELATAGGTARSTSPQYYAVTTATTSAFTQAMSAIAAQITATCTLQLNQEPPEPDLVNVFLNEQVLPQSGPDGWTLSGTTVTILGSSCAEITSGQVLDVRVVAGCPTQLQ